MPHHLLRADRTVRNWIYELAELIIPGVSHHITPAAVGPHNVLALQSSLPLIEASPIKMPWASEMTFLMRDTTAAMLH